MDLKPLFVWTGGKGAVIPEYRQRAILPKSFQRNDSYIEPFFGAGAMYCDVVNSGFKGELVINDRNHELMFIYHWIQEDPEAFISICEGLLKIRNALPIESEEKIAAMEAKNKKWKPQRKRWFYALRDEYWKHADLSKPFLGTQDTLTPSAMLFVMLLGGYRGFWLTVEDDTKKTFGRAKPTCGFLKDIELDVDLIREWSAVLKRTHIYSGDYQDIGIPTERAFIFIDPPYRDSEQDYGVGFSEDDQTDLVNWCIEQSKSDNTIVFANKEIFDDFFTKRFRGEDLYKTFPYTHVGGRTKGGKAKAVYELAVRLEPEIEKRRTYVNGRGKVTTGPNQLAHMMRHYFQYLDEGGDVMDFDTLLKSNITNIDIKSREELKAESLAKRRATIAKKKEERALVEELAQIDEEIGAVTPPKKARLNILSARKKEIKELLKLYENYRLNRIWK